MAKSSGGGGSGPTVAKAYVAIIPTTKDAQKNISKTLIPEMEAASNDAGKAGGESLVGSLGSALSAGVSKVASAAKVVAGAGVAALGALTTAAYGAFSDWEQLSGGVETIFGESTAQTVVANAQKAFGTVQLSANDYLNTVTSFSASLIQSLGGDTDRAANVADRAITDMADNANKMGTSMESLQYAYQGFSRGTFTMLDNLRLGYGGTQEEMLRLVHDAGVVDESITDISQVSFADMIEGIHIIQQNLGIAGASAAEASTTLEGSFNMMSASWQNLLVAFGEGTPDAIKPAVDNLISSVGTWLKNAVPRIGIILSGIVSYLPTLAHDIIAGLPGFAASIGDAIRASLSDIDLTSSMRNLMSGAMQNGLLSSIIAFGARISEAFHRVFGDIDISGKIESIRTGVSSVMSFIGGLVASASMAIAAFIDGIDTERLTMLMSDLSVAGEAILSILSDIGAVASEIFTSIVLPVVQHIWDFLTEHILPGLTQVYEAARPYLATIIDLLSTVMGWLKDIASAVLSVVKPAIDLIFQALGPVFDWLFDCLSAIIRVVGDVVSTIWRVIKPFYDTVVSMIVSTFNAIGGWLRALSDNFDTVVKFISAIVSSTTSWILNIVGGVIGAIASSVSGVAGTVQSIVYSIWDAISGTISWISSSVWNLIGSISSAFSWIYDIIVSPFQNAFNAVRNLWNSTIGNMSFSIPSWVPSIGGYSFSMPQLAQGGDMRVGGTVMVGEAGPEILTLPRGARVTPLSDADSSSTTYSVVVGDVNLSDDDQVKRATREYLEFLARIATPGGIVTR